MLHFMLSLCPQCSSLAACQDTIQCTKLSIESYQRPAVQLYKKGPVYPSVLHILLSREQQGCDQTYLCGRITMLEDELERMAPDLGVIEEWKRKDASYAQRLADLEAATAARNEV